MTQPAGRSLRGLLKDAFKVSLGIGLIAYLVWMNRDDIRRLEGEPIRLWLLAAGFAICLVATLATFFRWWLLVRAQGFAFSPRDCLRIGFIGYFFNLLIPGSVGGDFVKAVLLARAERRRAAAIATVVMDRILGLFALILLGALMVAVFWADIRGSAPLRQLAAWTMGLCVAACLGMLVLFAPWLYHPGVVRRLARLPGVGHAAEAALAAVAVYRANLTVVFVTLAMSVLSHVGFVLSLWVTRMALPGETPPARVHFTVAPLGLLVSAIPATPGGLGLAEGAMQKLFDFAGWSGSMALLMMLAYRGMQILIAVLGMAYYFADRRATRIALEAAARADTADQDTALLSS